MDAFWPERIDSLFVRNGICSFRSARKFFRDNIVEVNGCRVTGGGRKINSCSDCIFLNKKEIFLKKECYIIMNKARGLECSRNSSFSVYDVFSDELKNFRGTSLIHSVGRLDKDSTGLLLFTSNGAFSQRITNPSVCLKKTYQVRLDKKILPEEREMLKKSFASGIEVPCDGNFPAFRAKSAELECAVDDPFLCYLGICEGKFHQVKRMFRAFGFSVLSLKRVKISSLELDSNLGEGKWRFLQQEEMDLLFK